MSLDTDVKPARPVASTEGAEPVLFRALQADGSVLYFGPLLDQGGAVRLDPGDTLNLTIRCG